MNDKLLCWIGDAVYRFGIVKAIQDNYKCDLYSILDIDYRQKKFFENQKLVNFQKTWFYRDYVDLTGNQKPDIEFLQKFEERYGINLWNNIYSERYFYKYNTHSFSYNDLLRIIEQECKLFEKVIDDVQPQFLIIGTTDLHHNHLLTELCRAKNVQVLMTGGARFGYRELICEEPDKLSSIIYAKKIVVKKNEKTFEELRSYLTKFDNVKQITEFRKNLEVPISEKIRKFFELIFVYGGAKYRNQFERIGMTRKKIIGEIIRNRFNKRSTSSFVNRHLNRKLDSTAPFVYYPLHTEPERALSIAAPFYTNQIEVITHIAKSLPVGYNLYVKDHPGMSFKAGPGRTISFYNQIMDLPNVKLLHPEVSQDEILKSCSLVITINGTTGLEAAFYGKPALTLVETLYSHLPSVITIKTPEDLPHAIIQALEKKVEPSSLEEFVNFIEANSFEIDRKLLYSDFRNKFLYKEIDANEMKSYFKDHNSSFETIGLEYISKIKKIKDNKQ